MAAAVESIKETLRAKLELGRQALKVAESGIHSAQDVAFLRSHGFDGFLIGERFMKTPNPGKTCREFVQEINSIKSTQNA